METSEKYQTAVFNIKTSYQYRVPHVEDKSYVYHNNHHTWEIRLKPWYDLTHAPKKRIMLFGHISNFTNDLVESNLLLYPRILYSSNICGISPYNRQLFVITDELIYGVRGASRQEKSLWNSTIIIWYCIHHSTGQIRL